MAYWHELRNDTLSWFFPRKPGSRVAVIFSGADARVAPYQGRFIRYDGAGEVPKGLKPWRKNPEGWFDLWPREPLLASSTEEAFAVFTPLLPHLEDGSRDEQFDKRPCQPVAKSELVKDINHKTRLAAARIMKNPDGVFEVRYLVYAPNGKYFPAATPSLSAELEWEWGVTAVEDENGRQLRTLADDLGSAEEIAAIELDSLVAADPEIKPRPT